jgi:hypothetical protein
METTPTKHLGKIAQVSFGVIEGQLGLHVNLTGPFGGVNHSYAFWAIERSSYTKWTEADRTKHYDEIVRTAVSLLNEAKVRTVDELKNKPVEVTIDDGLIKSWRILTEVL